MSFVNSKFLVAVVFAFVLLSPVETFATKNNSNVVNVCNKGDVDLRYIVFATKSSFLGGDEAKISGWYKIEKGDCQNVNPEEFHGVSLYFLQKNEDGLVGNPVFKFPNVGKAEDIEAPLIICAPIEGEVDDESTLGALRTEYLPPCKMAMLK